MTKQTTPSSPPLLKVALSGAAGAICYSLIPLIASGYIFQDQPIELRLLEIPQALASLPVMELEDCAYPNLQNVICTTDPLVAFDNVDVIILVGGFPRKKGMARKDLIQANTNIFITMGRAIHDVASSNVKVLVVANPANTNCLVALTEASSRIPSKNFAALTYLDASRAKAQIANHLKVWSNQIKNVIIWGNHSETQYPDALTDGYYVNENGTTKQSLKSIFANNMEYTNNTLVHTVQNRGKAVIEARGASSALSAAMATADCLKTWLVTGTKDDEVISMAIYNDEGYYGIQKGIVFSFPVECSNGEWSVKKGLELSEFARMKLKITETELLEEREAAREIVDKSSASAAAIASSDYRKRSLSTASMPSLTSSESGMSLATSVDGANSAAPYLTSKM